MKRTMKEIARRITAVLNRLGEDFDMLLMEDILPYPSDLTMTDVFDDERLA